MLYAVFFASGAAALIYQSGWQRILTLHAGMDLYSVTTVIAAFMAGLGLGNMVGGGVAGLGDPGGPGLLFAPKEFFNGAFRRPEFQILQNPYPPLPACCSTTP